MSTKLLLTLAAVLFLVGCEVADDKLPPAPKQQNGVHEHLSQLQQRQPSEIERINGDNHYDKNPPPADQREFGSSTKWESYAYPSSNHPSSVNVAFCDGHIVTVSEQMDPRVYAQLMTSNRNRSKLKDDADVPDRQLPQPNDSDY